MHRGKVPPQAAQLAGKVPLQAAQLAAKAVKTLDDDEGTDDERLEAAETLMELATDVRNKAAVREAGGVQCLLDVLDDSPAEAPITNMAAEALACLAVGDAASRELMRRGNAADKLVRLLSAAGQGAERVVTTALLALRVLTDREADRAAIQRAGGFPVLVGLLGSGPAAELTEYAVAVLGNLAAGGHALKDALRDAGAIAPLVALLRDAATGEVAAELAAVVLRNLALGNAGNRDAIVDAGGLAPLLGLLSAGQEWLTQPMPCEMTYGDAKAGAAGRRKGEAGLCCFDPKVGQLCVAAAGRPGPLACVCPPKQGSPRENGAARYSCLRKLTLTEPDAETLEVIFVLADGKGVLPLPNPYTPITKPQQQLTRIHIAPCAATDLKGAIMRMLTRLHLELEFKDHIADLKRAAAEAQPPRRTIKKSVFNMLGP